jgi:hypothetical protein
LAIPSIQLRPSIARQKYPIRYWIFLAYGVGVPNFVRFDATGKTHDFGLFNPTSISTIVLTMTCAFLLAAVTLLGRRAILARKIRFNALLWIVLLVNLFIASVLQPASPNRPTSATDLPLSLYRLGEWVLGFLLLLSLYTREERDRTIDLMIRLIGSICWINIAMVWFFLPLIPSLVYATPDDIAGGAHARLGGALIHPVHLSVLAGVGFFYALFFMQGRKRFLACFIAAATLALTYARSEQIVFLLALFTYIIVLSRNLVMRLMGFSAIAVTAVIGLVFQGSIIEYLARGHGTRNITTLSERTDVWAASWKAIKIRPFIGYGFIAGVKQALHDQWNATNWVPPHAHSEFIQATVSGGFLAGIIVTALYVRAVWLAVRAARQGIKQTFILIVLLQITTMAFIMPLITVQFSRLACLFMICFVTLAAEATSSVKVRQAQTIYAPTTPELEWVSSTRQSSTAGL